MAIDQHAEECRAALTAVAHAMTPAQFPQFIATAYQRWPRLRGAEAADILDMTVSYDMFLDKTEPFFETFASHLPECGGNAPLYALHALIILGEELSPAKVTALLQKAGVTEAPRYPAAEAGILLADGSPANALLISSRAEKALRAAGAGEDAITAYRQDVRRTWPGHARNIGDIAGWVTLVDRYAPLSGPGYDPAHDLAVVLLAAVDANYRARTSPELAQALANLRERVGLSSIEEAEAHLRALLGGER